MTRPQAILAIHPQVLDMVFSASALAELRTAVDLRPAPADLWRGGWSRNPDVEILVTGWGTPSLDETALTAMPGVTAVFHAAGSVRDVIDVDVWARGIEVVSAADANNEMVAEYVVAQILLALKGTHRAAAFMATQNRLPAFSGGPGVRGATVGLVSYGSIARKVRERLRRFDSDVLAWDPFVTDADFATEGVRRADSLDALFAVADVVSLHTPLIPGVTEGLITRELLDRLASNAVLINTSRGAILDEVALVDVLRRRSDLYAILDVTIQEPLPPEHDLFGLTNVQLTGHTAGSVGRECLGLGRLVVDEVVRHAQGLPLHHSISKNQAALRA